MNEQNNQESQQVDTQKWRMLAERHWQEFLPKMYRQYKKEGILEEKLDEAIEHTLRHYQNLVQFGYRQQEAWEMVREFALILPPEDVD